ncbi:MAG: hypothetical protein RR614_12655, partial [Eubacterium sp.]
CTGEEHTQSYPQLFEQAVDETLRKIKKLDSILSSGSVTVSDAHEMYGNKCYDRALPCSSKLEMTHFDIIFEKYPQL